MITISLTISFSCLVGLGLVLVAVVVKLLDYSTSAMTLVGRHESSSSSNACSCLAAVPDTTNVLASASWNRQFSLWDTRSRQAIATLDLPGKAFSMDVTQNRIVVATSGRRNVIVDIRNQKPEIVLDRESSLKFQTRTIRFFPDGRGFALGSVEGRVGVEFLEELQVPAQSMKRYAFKCHRVGDTVYPVNCIAFHPKFTDAFATGGCDGTVVLWDGGNKKKVSSCRMLYIAAPHANQWHQGVSRVTASPL